ncbi:MAG: penicillin-binding protein 1C, partial [Bacteroidota bacterium]
PYEAMVQVPVCRYSGYRASSICEFTDSIWIPKNGMKTGSCPFHQWIHLDKTGQWQVHSGCEAPENMQHVSWFVLPPVQEWYFRNRNPFYKPLPPFRPDCAFSAERKNMEIIYPKNNSRIYVPVDLDGRPGSAVVKLAHRSQTAIVYWHLDDKFLGTTKQVHQMAISPVRGMHWLTLVDQNGEMLKIRFEVLAKE